MADDLTSVEGHLERILATVRPLPDFPQPLMETLGLAAAEDVVSPIRLPSFDNSGMDGYAVCHRDVLTASEESPVHLPVVGEIGAGHDLDRRARRHGQQLGLAGTDLPDDRQVHR